MVIQLYMFPPSPPVRAVQITAKALGIDLELKPIDLMKGEHKTPEFLKLNPQHTLPVINDNGTIIWDSHAISAYLVTKYAKNDSLYPKDPAKRAIVDQRLHFDTGVLFGKTMAQTLRPILYGQAKTVEQTQIDSVYETYEFLEKFLEGRKWIAGDSVTIADYCIYTTLGTVSVVVPVNPDKFPKLNDWFKKVDGLPESEVARDGFNMFADVFRKMLGQ